jgi:hypothetical protein
MRHLQVKRPRISTMVLAALFLATFALYLLVRPVPVEEPVPHPAAEQLGHPIGHTVPLGHAQRVTVARIRGPAPVLVLVPVAR